MREISVVAFNLKMSLLPDCARAEIAGSLRRDKEDPKDIELVVIPKLAVTEQRNLLGEVTSRTTISLLESVSLPGLIASGAWEYDTENKKNGPAYKRLRHIPSGIPVDLFITDHDKWGVIFTIRTGPAAFSKALVTLARQQRKHVTDGRLHNHSIGRKMSRAGDFTDEPCDKGDRCPLIIPTREEADFFRALNLPYMEPHHRTADAFRRVLAQSQKGSRQ